MIIIRKKTIFNCLMLFCICYMSYAIIKNSNKEEQVVALPVSDKVIVIDSGHGGEDGGATSENGISESNINLAIALKLQKLLEQSGATVILTRSTDEAIYDTDSNGSIREKKISDLKNRVKIGNESSADVFVSIHLNKIPQEQYYGWQTFYRNNDEQSKKLAESIQNNLNESIQKENHRLARTIKDIYIVDKVEIPITIVECGFLSNAQELKDLQNEEYQERLAWGIYNGIMDWFNGI